MSQNFPVSRRSGEGKLTFRIVGRKKKFIIDKVIGEARERLDPRILKAINSDPRSLRDHRVPY